MSLAQSLLPEFDAEMASTTEPWSAFLKTSLNGSPLKSR